MRRVPLSLPGTACFQNATGCCTGSTRPARWRVGGECACSGSDSWEAMRGLLIALICACVLTADESFFRRQPVAPRSLNGAWIVVVSRKFQSRGDLDTLQSFGLRRLRNGATQSIQRVDTAPANRQLRRLSSPHWPLKAPNWQQIAVAGTSNAKAIPCGDAVTDALP